MNYAFTAATGTPAEINVLQYFESASASAIAVQNEGVGQITVKGKLKGSSTFCTIGTVAATTITTFGNLPDLSAIQITGDATGVISVI